MLIFWLHFAVVIACTCIVVSYTRRVREQAREVQESYREIGRMYRGIEQWLACVHRAQQRDTPPPMLWIDYNHEEDGT